MSLTSLMFRPCTIVRREASGSTNAYGDKIDSETAVSTTCELQQRGRGEGEDDVSDTRWLCVLPIDTEIHSGDAVIVDGETYEVDGEPWRANSGNASMHHVEVTLRRTAGPGDEVGS